ncbi:MAG: OmpA family protein [Polyangiaceae bacterium]|nr:OmpA family protein [Polyangiaceae bacterium]
MSDARDSDLDAILARRAMLISTALAALSCGSGGEGSPSVHPTGSTTDRPAVTATASASQSARVPPAALRSWDEVLRDAPPRGIPASVKGAEAQQLEWLERGLSSEYDTVKGVWTGAPDCDAASPDCRSKWREVGKLAKAMYDQTRGPIVAGCGGAGGETATVIGRRAAHRRYVQKLITEAEEHLTAVAASFSPQGEQEWRKILANAKQPPPMPCLSPCAMPDVSTIVQSIAFAKDARDVRSDDAAVTAAIQAIVATFKANRAPSKIVVRGHADAGEKDPAELATARAKSVVALLLKAGLPKDSVTSVGLGADLPVERSDEKGNAAANQRVDFEAVATAKP